MTPGYAPPLETGIEERHQRVDVAGDGKIECSLDPVGIGRRHGFSLSPERSGMQRGTSGRRSGPRSRIRRISRTPPSDILTGVTKRLIDVDDDKLEAVRALLGTRTLKATVDDAFNEVLALAQRRRALLAERGVEPDVLADPATRRDAWG